MKRKRIMGKTAMKILILLPFFLCLIGNNIFVYAQESQTQNAAKEKQREKDVSFTQYCGIQIAAGADFFDLVLRPMSVNPADYGYTAVPQLGYRFHLGLVAEKNTSKPISIFAEFARAHNIDKDMTGLVSSTSVLDMGIEGAAWVLANKKLYTITVDGGLVASRCDVVMGESLHSHRWGVGARYGSTVYFKLKNNMSTGIKVFGQTARYLSKSNDALVNRFDRLNTISASLFFLF